jgi:hypothetical protein
MQSAKDFVEELFLLGSAGNCYTSTEAQDEALEVFCGTFLGSDKEAGKTFLKEIEKFMTGVVLTDDLIADFCEDYRRGKND